MEKGLVEIKKISPLTVGKIFGLMYAIFGLIIGAIFSCVSLVGGVAASEATGNAFVGLVAGVGAIIVMPIFYGIMGFILGILSSVIYNLVAGQFGGIEMELG
ncbi:MAG: hypothetical protein ACK2T4_00650 [Candidatus Promineifilaceae bacterium]|jgi:hypothetical protein